MGSFTTLIPFAICRACCWWCGCDLSGAYSVLGGATGGVRYTYAMHVLCVHRNFTWISDLQCSYNEHCPNWNFGVSNVHTLHIHRIAKLVVNNVHTMNRVYNNFNQLCMLITRTGTPCKYECSVSSIFRTYVYLYVVSNPTTRCERVYTTVWDA